MNERTTEPEVFTVFPIGHCPNIRTEDRMWQIEDFNDAMALMGQIAEPCERDGECKWGYGGVTFFPKAGIKVLITNTPTTSIPNCAIIKICDGADNVLLIGVTQNLRKSRADMVVWTEKNGALVTTIIRLEGL